MSKLTIPIEEVKIGGTLNSFYYDNVILRSDVINTTDELNAYAEGNFNLSITEVGNILTNGGEVEQLLMAVQAPIALFDQDLPLGLPKRVYFDSVVKTFREWFTYGAEIWIKDNQTEILFYTNPFASNEESYLKGSEIAIINAISASVLIKTIAEAEAITATGWTKI